MKLNAEATSITKELTLLLWEHNNAGAHALSHTDIKFRLVFVESEATPRENSPQARTNLSTGSVILLVMADRL